MLLTKPRYAWQHRHLRLQYGEGAEAAQQPASGAVSAYVSIRQHTSAYVSIATCDCRMAREPREHSSAAASFTKGVSHVFVTNHATSYLRFSHSTEV
jgi:hypothetical protein